MHDFATGLRLWREVAFAVGCIWAFEVIVEVELLLVGGGELLHPGLWMFGRVLHLILSNDHLVVPEVVVLHLVLVVGGPFHGVGIVGLLVDARGGEHGLLPVVCFGGVGLERHVLKCGDGDAGGHWLLLHELSDLEGLVVGVVAAEERILLAGSRLLAALPAVLLLHYLVVLADYVLPVHVLKVQRQVLHFLLVLGSVQDQLRGEALG